MADNPSAKAPSARPIDIISALGARIKDAVMPDSGEPVAYTRVTRTPVKWGAMADDTYGQYFPDSGSIKMNAAKLPQHNADGEYMSNILRHEQVHALLPPETIKAIQDYFEANPATAARGRSEMLQRGIDAGESNRGLAQEAPAYAVQGYRFSLPDDIMQQYMSRMPADVLEKYKQLGRWK